jgi:hypothetical protein
MTSDVRFHADHTNPGVGMMQVTTGESSEILSLWTGNRDPVSKWIRKRGLNRAWCDVVRWVAIKGVFTILLR